MAKKKVVKKKASKAKLTGKKKKAVKKKAARKAAVSPTTPLMISIEEAPLVEDLGAGEDSWEDEKKQSTTP